MRLEKRDQKFVWDQRRKFYCRFVLVNRGVEGGRYRVSG